MKQEEKNANAIEQLEDLLNKGILTAEEYEAKKQQISSSEPEIPQEQDKQRSDKRAKLLYTVVSSKLVPVKAFAMKRKKLTCVILAALLLIIGFVPGYSIGKSHPSNVRLTFGAPDEAIEVKGKGSSKNPYHLNEDIVFVAFNTDCGLNVTYTVNISRILRPSALSRYMAPAETWNYEGIIGSITATWESVNVKDISITPKIGILAQGNTRANSALTIKNRDGSEIHRLQKDYTYSNAIFMSPHFDENEYDDYILINYKVKASDGKLLEHKIYVSFDPSVIEI